jgi:hypothetical protein
MLFRCWIEQVKGRNVKRGGGVGIPCRIVMGQVRSVFVIWRVAQVFTFLGKERCSPQFFGGKGWQKSAPYAARTLV